MGGCMGESTHSIPTHGEEITYHMRIGTTESPTHTRWFRRDEKENRDLDAVALSPGALWSHAVYAHIRDFYESSFLVSTITGTAFPPSMELWHLTASSRPAGIGLSIDSGRWVLACRHARLRVTGRQSRGCHVLHLWRQSPAAYSSSVFSLSDEQHRMHGLVVSDLSVPDVDPGLGIQEVVIGDDWTLIAYQGPIAPHPEEQFQLTLLAHGIVFVRGPHGTGETAHLFRAPTTTPMVMEERNPFFVGGRADFPPPGEIGCYRRAGHYWALRLALPHDEPRLYQAIEEVKTRVIPSLAQLKRFHQLRLFASLEENRPITTLVPEDPRELPLGLHKLNMTPAQFDMPEGLHFSVDETRRTLRAVWQPTLLDAARVVRFVPLQRRPRILLYVDSHTLFCLDRGMASGGNRPPGLPMGFTICGIRFSQPLPDVVDLINQRLGLARTAEEVAAAMVDLFGTTGAVPVDCLDLSYFDPPLRSAPGSPMDLDPPVRNDPW